MKTVALAVVAGLLLATTSAESAGYAELTKDAVARCEAIDPSEYPSP